MIDVSYENVPGYFLLLEMAFQAERRIAFIQQALVYGPVRRMADRTALAHCLMLVDKRAALLGMTFETGFVSTEESKTAGFKRLLDIRLGPFCRDPLVRIVTIAAAHLAFQHRMMVRQLECGADIQVTLETSLGRLSRIDNRTSSATGFDV